MYISCALSNGFVVLIDQYSCDYIVCGHSTNSMPQLISRLKWSKYIDWKQILLHAAIAARTIRQISLFIQTTRKNRQTFCGHIEII